MEKNPVSESGEALREKFDRYIAAGESALGQPENLIPQNEVNMVRERLPVLVDTAIENGEDWMTDELIERVSGLVERLNNIDTSKRYKQTGE